jgi:hypothetical protein
MLRRREFLKGTAASLLYATGNNVFAQSQNRAAGSVISFDDRSVLLDGRRVLLACGEVHYPRSTRAMWPLVLERSKALGLNTIATYVF